MRPFAIAGGDVNDIAPNDCNGDQPLGLIETTAGGRWPPSAGVQAVATRAGKGSGLLHWV